MTTAATATPAQVADTTPDAGLLAAVNAALEGKSAPETVIEPVVDDADTTPAEGDTPAGDVPAGDAPAGDAPPTGGDAPAAGDAPAGEAKPGDAPAPAAATPANDAKPSDAFGDLPQDAKAETRERFGKLKTAYDERTAELSTLRERAEAAEAERTQWVETVRSTGADAQQFGQALQFLSDFNSGDPKRFEQAFTSLLGQVTEMAKVLGRELPGIHDPLEGHPDLKELLDDGVDREKLVRLAAERDRAAMLTTARTQEATSQNVERVAQQELGKVKAFGAEMRAREPQLFEAKMRVLAPSIEAIVADLPPEKWMPKIRDLYARIEVPAPAPRAPAARVPDPVRSTAAPAAGGTVARTPGSELEAVDAALAALGRGGR